jgi:hypothetical protein
VFAQGSPYLRGGVLAGDRGGAVQGVGEPAEDRSVVPPFPSDGRTNGGKRPFYSPECDDVVIVVSRVSRHHHDRDARLGDLDGGSKALLTGSNHENGGGELMPE